MDDRDWLALAVYDEFRGVPLRKLIAHGHLPILAEAPSRQQRIIRLGALFFEGRCWRQLAGVTVTDVEARLSASARTELEQCRALRGEVGAAALRFICQDRTLSHVGRDTLLERLESMGFIATDG